MKDKINRMAGNTENTQKLKSGSFTIQLDETTFAEEAILIVYVRYIDNAELKQDILISPNLPTTTWGEDIFGVVDTSQNTIFPITI